MFKAEFPGMAATVPGKRIEKLSIGDRCLKTVNHGRISQCCSGIGYGYVSRNESGGHSVAGNGEGGEGSVGHSGQTNLGGQILAKAGARVQELSAQIGVTELIRQPATESVCI